MATPDPPEPTPIAPTNAPPSGRKALRAEINKRYAVHLNMVLILSVCFGVGLIVTKLLLMAGISAMWLRYSAALFVAYAAFLAGIRLWLAYAGYAALPDADSVSNANGRRSSGWRSPNFGRNDVGGSAQAGFRGGGGRYGGGGASASFAGSDGDPGTPVGSAPLVSTTLSSAADGNGGDWADGGGSGGSGGSGDLGVVVVVIAAIALIAVIFGGVIYVIYMAPKILGDAAFSALLSAGLVRSTHRIRTGGWVGSAVLDTWRPFLAVFALALAFALTAQHFYPDAVTFSDVLRRLRS